MDTKQYSEIIEKIEKSTLKLDRKFTYYLSLNLDSDEIAFIRTLEKNFLADLEENIVRTSGFNQKDVDNIDYASLGVIIDLIPLEKKIYNATVDYNLGFPKLSLKIYDNHLKRYYKEEEYRKSVEEEVLEKLSLKKSDVNEIVATNDSIVVKLSSELLFEDSVFEAFDRDKDLANFLIDISKESKFYDVVQQKFNEFLQVKVKDLKRVLFAARDFKDKEKELLNAKLLPKRDEKKEKSIEIEIEEIGKKLRALNKSFQYTFENYLLANIDPNSKIRDKVKLLNILEAQENPPEEVLQKTGKLSMDIFNIAKANGCSAECVREKILIKNILPTLIEEISTKYKDKLFEAEKEERVFSDKYIEALSANGVPSILELRSFKYLITAFAEKLVRDLKKNGDYQNFDRAGYGEKFETIFRMSMADRTNVNYKDTVKLATDILDDFSQNNEGTYTQDLRETINKYHGLRGDMTPIDTSKILAELNIIKREMKKVDSLFQMVFEVIKFESLLIPAIRDLGIDAREKFTELGVALGEKGTEGFYISEINRVLGILNVIGSSAILKERVDSLIIKMSKINITLQKDSPEWTSFNNESGMQEHQERGTDDSGASQDILSWMGITEKFSGKSLLYELHKMLANYSEESPDGQRMIDREGKIKLLYDELEYLKDRVDYYYEEEKKLKEQVKILESKLAGQKKMDPAGAEVTEQEFLKLQSKLNTLLETNPFTIAKGRTDTKVVLVPQNVKKYDAKLVAQDKGAKTIESCRTRVVSMGKWLSFLQDEVDKNLGITGGRVGDLSSGLNFELLKAIKDKEQDINARMRELRRIKTDKSKDVIKEMEDLINNLSTFYSKKGIYLNPFETTPSLIPGKIPKNYFNTVRDKMIGIYSNKTGGNIDPVKEVDKFLKEHPLSDKEAITKGLRELLKGKIEEDEHDALIEIVENYFMLKEQESNRGSDEKEIEKTYQEIQSFTKRVSSTDIDDLSSTLKTAYEGMKQTKKVLKDPLNLLVKKISEFDKDSKTPAFKISRKSDDVYQIALQKSDIANVASKFSFSKEDRGSPKAKSLLWKQFNANFLKLYKVIEEPSYKKKYTQIYYDIAKTVFGIEIKK